MTICRPVADRAVLVEFGTTITEAAHDAVMKLDAALAARPIAGFVEAVPAYVNLLVVFDPMVTDHAAIEAGLRKLMSDATPPQRQATERDVLVCYDPDLAPDLVAVAKATGLSPEAVIAAHLAGDYSVYLYGFAPGYAYLAGVPEPLRLPRKTQAVRGIPAGSVLIAGAQCIVSTLTMPTGWWIIGRSPTKILRDDPQQPFLFDVGDRVRFRQIDRATFDAEGGT